jgi:hypothetical protein
VRQVAKLSKRRTVETARALDLLNEAGFALQSGGRYAISENILGVDLWAERPGIDAFEYRTGPAPSKLDRTLSLARATFLVSLVEWLAVGVGIVLSSSWRAMRWCLRHPADVVRWLFIASSPPSGGATATEVRMRVNEKIGEIILRLGPPPGYGSGGPHPQRTGESPS